MKSNSPVHCGLNIWDKGGAQADGFSILFPILLVIPEQARRSVMALPRWPAVLSVTQDAFLEVERLRWCFGQKSDFIVR